MAYIQAKLVQYKARGAQVNIAACHHALGAPFVVQGDYNQGISHYLRLADMYRAFNRYSQENELQVVGNYYAEWGNPTKALYFLRQSLAVDATLPRRNGFDRNCYTYWAMVQAYRQLRNYPAALRYANLSLAGVPTDTTRRYAADVPTVQSYGLVVKSAVLLDMRRVAEAGHLLAWAQHLADSLKLNITGSSGVIELDATWARYYAARNEPARAEAAWLIAFRKAREMKIAPLRLAYLRALADFYAQRGKDGPAGRYARTALALSDSLGARQGAFHVAQYEAEQAQQARIAGLRLAQVQRGSGPAPAPAAGRRVGRAGPADRPGLRAVARQPPPAASQRAAAGPAQRNRAGAEEFARHPGPAHSEGEDGQPGRAVGRHRPRNPEPAQLRQQLLGSVGRADE